MLTLPWTGRSAALMLLSGLAALAGLYLAEQHLPQLGLWLFIALSLTLGMGHGALDAALLLGQFKPASTALACAAIYMLLTVIAAWLLSMSLAWALLVLLAMSVWHFGETYAPNTALRLAVGGASVMAPMLLQGQAMAALLPVLVGNDAAWAGTVWRALTWLWVVGSVIALLWRTGGGWRQQGSPQQRAVIEVAVVILLFAVLTPLLAFALYFGLYHCTSHILRVQRAVARHQGATRSRMAWVWGASSALTAVLLVALWQYLPGSVASGSLNTQMLQWLVVALGAVTLPHLILVGYSGRWLGR